MELPVTEALKTGRESQEFRLGHVNHEMRAKEASGKAKCAWIYEPGKERSVGRNYVAGI